MREVTFNKRPALLLREPKPVEPPPVHTCVVQHGTSGVRKDWRMVVQCDCGKRYKCRQDFVMTNSYMWVRRLLPWPPRQKNWPKDKD